MPVNIFDIPSEEKTSQKALSLWVEFGICVCILAVYNNRVSNRKKKKRNRKVAHLLPVHQKTKPKKDRLLL
ncbi:hypothetical protein [Klebsiella variicola]|uniref:hypothetical protein n=1 Tax=Klebsiella variicola TaxID=244366 RepID=UPI000908323A|nr:hypothetical protein [Klebsiella variicola]